MPLAGYDFRRRDAGGRDCTPGSSERSTSGFLHVAILRRPDFFFLQAAMEPFDVAVALRVMISRAPMRDPQPVQCFDKARRSELCSVVGGQGHTGLATSCR